MILYVDTDTNQFVSDALHKVPLDSVSFKRGDAASIELRFVEGNTVTPLESGSAIAFGIKPASRYDDDFLVFTDSVSSIGDSYLIAPSFNTVTLDEELNKDGNPENDVASLQAMLEVTWSEDGVSWQSTDTIVATIANDVIRGSESSPVELDTPEDWLAEHGIVYDPAITGLTGGGSTKLDGIATVDVDAGRLQAVVEGEIVRLYTLNAGTAVESSPIFILPDDYNASTNAKHWKLKDVEARLVRSSLGVRTPALEMNSTGMATAILYADYLVTDRYFQWPDADGVIAVGNSYADDSDAATTGGLLTGDIYFNTTRGVWRAVV